jgi:hypothetical protein
MDGTVDVLDGDPDVVICVDEFGPLNPSVSASGEAGGSTESLS